MTRVSGQTISGATGTPGTNYYANCALYFDATTAAASLTLQNLRVANALTAISISGYTNHVLSHVQLLNCANGLALTNNDAALRNALMDHVLTNFTGSSSTGRVEHLTVDTSIWLNQNIGTNLYLTNCLLAAVTNGGSFSSNTVYSVTTTNGIFKVAGAGYHYLADGSPYRDIGTANINPDLAKDLRTRTTYPPLTLAGTLSTNAVLSPQATWRDTDVPDLGYHYDALDYLVGDCLPGTHSLTMTNGVAVGLYNSYGFFMTSGHFTSTGRPDAMNRLGWYPAVQEQPIVLSEVSVVASGIFTVANAAQVYQFRYTDLPMQGALQSVFVGGAAYTYNFRTVSFQDCWLRGLDVNLAHSAAADTEDCGATVNCTLVNNLLERASYQVYDGDTGYWDYDNLDDDGNPTYVGINSLLALNCTNNTFWRSTFSVCYLNYNDMAPCNPLWGIKDNLFDNSTANFYPGGSTYGSYTSLATNAFYNTSASGLGGTGNITVTSLGYAMGLTRALGTRPSSPSSGECLLTALRRFDRPLSSHYADEPGAGNELRCGHRFPLRGGGWEWNSAGSRWRRHC